MKTEFEVMHEALDRIKEKATELKEDSILKDVELIEEMLDRIY